MMMSNKTPKFLLPLSLEDGAGSSSSSSSWSSSSSSNDLLTSLPEPLLLQILSFLPFRSAVQTSVLSSQWRHLYKKRAENLIISASPTRFPSDIESSIAGGGGGILPLDSLHLIARCRHINEYIPHWLLLASRRRVRDVTIDLPGVPKPPVPATYVPFSSLTSLARLTLCGAQIDLRDHFVNLRSLEVLNLYRVWVSDRDLNTIVRGCSMLRTLDVRRCPGLLRLVVPTTAQWLRSVTVVDCPNLLEIRILGRARSFRRFHCCEGHVTTYHFDSLFKLELEDVYMSCSGKGMQDRVTNWWPALGRLCHVRVLTLCSRSLSSIATSGEFRNFPCLRELQLLMMTMTESNVMDIWSFFRLCLCPGLEKLFIEFLPHMNGTGGSCYDENEQPPAGVFPNLKVIKMNRFEGGQFHMLLVRTLLWMATHLETMLLVAPQVPMGEVAKSSVDCHPHALCLLRMELDSMVKSSENAKIVVREHDDHRVRPTHDEVYC